MMPIRRLGLIANLTRPRVREGLEALAAAARRAGIELLTPPATADLTPGARPCEVADFATQGAQGVISLGGDGSLLAAAHAIAATALPLIGFNSGHLGYLTAVNEEGFAEALTALATGNYDTEERTTLAAELHPDAQTGAPLPDALNDLVISRVDGGHAITLRLTVDGYPVARWLCDGLILATPTGSTAYSLSVGGPIVMPSAPTITLSVIAPHALTARPIVLPNTARVELAIETEGTTAQVYTDGQYAGALTPGDTLTCVQSPRTLRLLAPRGHNPYERLSRKLGWGAGFTR